MRAAIGPEVALRLDANGAWATAAEAAEALRALAPAAPELIEEPVHGVAALRELQAALPELPLALDESGVEAGALSSGATRLVCLKLTRCGGSPASSRPPRRRAPPAARSSSPRPSTGRSGSPARSTPPP